MAEDAQEIRTPWSRERISAAPRHDDGEPLGAELQRAAHEHLGRGLSGSRPGEAELVRSEEELHVRTHLQSYGGARLHKTVELEEVARQVPIHADFVQLYEIDVPARTPTRARSSGWKTEKSRFPCSRSAANHVLCRSRPER